MKNPDSAFLITSVWTLAALHTPDPRLQPVALLLACYWGTVFLIRLYRRLSYQPAPPRHRLRLPRRA